MERHDGRVARYHGFDERYDGRVARYDGFDERHDGRVERHDGFDERYIGRVKRHDGDDERYHDHDEHDDGRVERHESRVEEHEGRPIDVSAWPGPCDPGHGWLRPRPMLLDRPIVLRAFERLDAQLAAASVRADLFLVGGAVMCLVHPARPSTKNVDGGFTEPQAVRRAAQTVAGELDLPDDWLDDAAKGFVPPNAGYERWQVFPNLTVSTADTETLPAMKCAAARTDADVADRPTLSGILGLTSSDQILDVVLRYFHADRLPVRSRLLLEETFDEGS